MDADRCGLLTTNGTSGRHADNGNIYVAYHEHDRRC